MKALKPKVGASSSYHQYMIFYSCKLFPKANEKAYKLALVGTVEKYYGTFLRSPALVEGTSGRHGRPGHAKQASAPPSALVPEISWRIWPAFLLVTSLYM